MGHKFLVHISAPTRKKIFYFVNKYNKSPKVSVLSFMNLG